MITYRAIRSSSLCYHDFCSPIPIINPIFRCLPAFQFVRREYMVSRAHTEKSVTGTEKDAHSWFGVRTCQTMLESLLSLDDIDIDILLLLRDEVSCWLKSCIILSLPIDNPDTLWIIPDIAGVCATLLAALSVPVILCY